MFRTADGKVGRRVKLVGNASAAGDTAAALSLPGIARNAKALGGSVVVTGTEALGKPVSVVITARAALASTTTYVDIVGDPV